VLGLRLRGWTPHGIERAAEGGDHAWTRCRNEIRIRKSARGFFENNTEVVMTMLDDPAGVEVTRHPWETTTTVIELDKYGKLPVQCVALRASYHGSDGEDASSKCTSDWAAAVAVGVYNQSH